jgi:phospholipid transport system substrate-binding protein
MRRIHAVLVRAFAVLAFAVAAAGAQAATPAEDYIQANIQRGLDILNDHAAPPEQRREQFRAFLESLTDFNRVALFTLGSAADTASDADKAAFETSFHNYAVAVYNSRLSHYDGQTLKVTGSTERAPGDFIVHCAMTDPSGGDQTAIDFRVLENDGKFLLMDASVEGIWLSLEERAQFAGFLDNHTGDIHALIQHLDALTATLRAG